MSKQQQKRIEHCKLPLKDLKTGFGNPRTISQTKLKSLEASLQNHGDFGVIVIDEDNNIISGNQRVQALKNSNLAETVDCKRLIGYSDMEKRTINIRANVNDGDWNYAALDNWLQDMKNQKFDISLTGLDIDMSPINIKDLPPITGIPESTELPEAKASKSPKTPESQSEKLDEELQKNPPSDKNSPKTAKNDPELAKSGDFFITFEFHAKQEYDAVRALFDLNGDSTVPANGSKLVKLLAFSDK